MKVFYYVYVGVWFHVCISEKKKILFVYQWYQFNLRYYSYNISSEVFRFSLNTVNVSFVFTMSIARNKIELNWIETPQMIYEDKSMLAVGLFRTVWLVHFDGDFSKSNFSGNSIQVEREVKIKTHIEYSPNITDWFMMPCCSYFCKITKLQWGLKLQLICWSVY